MQGVVELNKEKNLKSLLRNLLLHMRFSILILGAIITACSGDTQNNRHDMEKEDLKKYSYLISGDVNLPIGNGHMQGTGFFIKRSDKLFFVCAKHTLSGCDDKNIKDDRTPDTMNIHVGDYLIPIDAKPIKNSAPCLPLVLDPDIISIPIETTKIKSSINSINVYEGKIPE